MLDNAETDLWGVRAGGMRFGVDLACTGEMMLCLSFWAQLGSPLEKGINTNLQEIFLGWAPQPLPQLSPGLSWHVPLPCHDFQLLHSEVTSKSQYILYPPVPFSFSLVAFYCRQPFWHVLYQVVTGRWVNGQALNKQGQEPKIRKRDCSAEHCPGSHRSQRKVRE